MVDDRRERLLAQNANAKAHTGDHSGEIVHDTQEIRREQLEEKQVLFSFVE